MFATLSIMLIAAVLFTLAEAGRSIKLKQVARGNADSALESMFTRYQIPLWENYRLLGVDSSNEQGQLDLNQQERFLMDLTEKSSSGSLKQRNSVLNLVKMNLSAAEFEKYTLLTDGDGVVYQELISSYMKENAVALAVEELQEQTTKMDELNSKIGEPEKNRKAVKEITEQPEATYNKNKDALVKDSEEITNVVDEEAVESLEKTSCDNPINQVETLEKKGILSLVLEENVEISKKEIENVEMLLSNRDKDRGTNSNLPKESFSNRILMEQYFQKNFSSFGEMEMQGSENKELNYEMEYILEGKSSDYENLKEISEKLVGIREVANLTYLLTDGVKMSEAENLAIVLAGVSANPVIIEIVKYGILASWAYGESILDVRALLKGNKIAIMKNKEEWTLELSDIGVIGDSFVTAKECKNGITYSQYLSSLIILQPLKKNAYRALDLTERLIQHQREYKEVQLDQIIVQAQVKFQYEWNTVFLGIGAIGKHNQKISYTYDTQYAYFD